MKFKWMIASSFFISTLTFAELPAPTAEITPKALPEKVKIKIADFLNGFDLEVFHYGYQQGWQLIVRDFSLIIPTTDIPNAHLYNWSFTSEEECKKSFTDPDLKASTKRYTLHCEKADIEIPERKIEYLDTDEYNDFINEPLQSLATLLESNDQIKELFIKIPVSRIRIYIQKRMISSPPHNESFVERSLKIDSINDHKYSPFLSFCFTQTLDGNFVLTSDEMKQGLLSLIPAFKQREEVQLQEKQRAEELRTSTLQSIRALQEILPSNPQTN